jgi:CheY-like chemotaxis protein
MRQIFINLLNNAVKFTEQGNVTLSIKVLKQVDDTVDLLFSVIDTGIGIPEEKAHLLFDKFSQIDSSLSREYGGSGLGLAISKKLVDAMGGEIGFKKNSDHGSTFYVALKLSIAPESSIEKSTDESYKDSISSGLSILLAEDNKINSYAAKTLMEQDGHHVTIAADGEEAVNAVINSDKIFDVILMDIHMPKVDGIEACRRIRAMKDKDKRSIPVIALTANILQDEKQKCFEAGMNSFITKPFSPEKLNAEMAALLRTN